MSVGSTPNQQQKEKAEQNRLNAKMLLTRKQTFGLVTAMGLSWFSALETEFSKPYFLKVSVTLYRMVLDQLSFLFCMTSDDFVYVNKLYLTRNSRRT